MLLRRALFHVARTLGIQRCARASADFNFGYLWTGLVVLVNRHEHTQITTLGGLGQAVAHSSGVPLCRHCSAEFHSNRAKRGTEIEV